ncbi:hypothetical protein CMV30_11880 [Nibricoccus aquaticus]|uniref:Amidohydrolase-related domain-containing protein n=1 Tax=Nibricoccus aquaticus TaxID=2576891 RepID=A0A290Q8M8_9BACT|nr:amidohydrolase family protein [Nibricoccus aquaticus]ATC64597.1 hypothetical protein CMV30_11880 [Nibricoccus aquaticus]
MKLFDANTWIGAWPFALLTEFTAASLAKHLKAHKIDRALVSSLQSVFHPEPGFGNRHLLRETRRQPALVPVPVINPSLANWREELATVTADSRVRAVRILPNYHNYRLTHRAVNALLHELHSQGLRLIVNARLIDERHEYFAMKMKGVPTADLSRLLRRHPDVPILATGLGRTEIIALTPEHPNLLAEFSYAEWHNTVEYLLTRADPSQLVFGTLTPFLVTEAGVRKLTTAKISPADAKKMSSENLRKFLAV